ncbi:MAG: hypothetical protein PF638_08435 [Candidatus Delongbacteria bacterium]|jgi:hypothetical protein|nr:hypothetical protein [Candidatus Delongbacteria bacterium]
MRYMSMILNLLLISITLLYGLANINEMYKVQNSTNILASKANKPNMECRVHRAGLLWLNTSNTGWFGDPWTYFDDPCTGKPVVMGEMPGGSGVNFIWVASLWCGGYLDSMQVDVDGVSATVFQGPLVSTSYEGWKGDPMPREMWPIKFDDDPSGSNLGHIKETSNIEGRINCLFQDVYDPSATAEEQFNTMYTDKYVNKTPYTGEDDYDKRDHIPLGLEIRQKSYAWSYNYAQKFVIVDYTFYNRNEEGKDIYDFFMGMYVDSDIGMIGGDWNWRHADDLCGFIQKWENFIDPATDQPKTVDLNFAWSADNDGRNYTGDNIPNEPGSGHLLDGATGVAALRVLRNPNPTLRYSFNIFVYDSDDESLDWGPHWKTGLHGPNMDPIDGIDPLVWNYDLTPLQKGYDDSNYDNLFNDSGQFMYNGRTEGRPIADRGKYMVMSNDEFDYDQTKIRKVFNGSYSDPDYMEGTPFAQADKWQKWIVTGEEIGGEVPDGSIKALNDIANGMDERYLLSFGPLGYESNINVAKDSDQNGFMDDVLNKNIWKFAYGDSLKLTLAFIVNENFHTSLEQDPNYSDDSVVDLNDGLDDSLYDKGWYDALYNVLWAERVYDIPMHDTPVTKNGEQKTDGWFGEDVGEDGLFADILNSDHPVCWWVDVDYSGPDEGEGDFEITDFISEVTDVYGGSASNEDELLPFGREVEDIESKYGITGSSIDGEGYGYMVKYDKKDGLFPQGTWVRYGFGNEKIDTGDGVPDFTGPPPPPSPKINVTCVRNDVIVEWASHEFNLTEDGNYTISGPEHFIDTFSRRKDFEGYEVMRSHDAYSQNYVSIFSIDKYNYIYENVGETGDFYDVPFEEDSIFAHPENYPSTFSDEGKIWQLIPYGDNRSLYTDHSEDDMYSYFVSLDSMEIMISDSLQVIKFYKYKFVLHNQLLANKNYIAVTATDNGEPKSGVPALSSSPSINGTPVIPTQITGSKEIVVVPNPYRGDVDYEYLGWENTEGYDNWVEQDRKIVFMNLPLRCIIRIYTLAGDLIKTIGHNGNARDIAPWMYGERGAYWNLINENNQAVVSGIYLFSVQDVDSDFEFVGKFVIIK